MHYYQHHIGDFIKATARLTDSQSMAYLRLLWMYYDTEKPLKPDVKALAFQIGATVEETQLLLESFFWSSENGWQHTRCEEEIAEYRAYKEGKSKAGRASADQRKKNNSTTGDEQTLNGCSTGVQLTTNHKPLTNNQEPSLNTYEPKGSLGESKIPSCPHQQIVDLFHEMLPTLPKVVVWNNLRQGLLRARWREMAVKEKWETVEDGIEGFRKFFNWVGRSPFLMGKVANQGRRPFECELEWLLRPSNFVKIIEGKYHAT